MIPEYDLRELTNNPVNDKNTDKSDDEIESEVSETSKVIKDPPCELIKNTMNYMDSLNKPK